MQRDTRRNYWGKQMSEADKYFTEMIFDATDDELMGMLFEGLKMNDKIIEELKSRGLDVKLMEMDDE